MEWLVQITSLIILGILLRIYLDWKRLFPVYIIFFLVTGLTTTWISHMLVLSGFLEFPHRIFGKFTLNNPLYDLLLLPALQLLLIQLFQKGKKYVSILVFAIVLSVQDYLISHFTNLLRFHTWTLIHTFLFGCIHFTAAIWFYNWLVRVCKNSERNAAG